MNSRSIHHSYLTEVVHKGNMRKTIGKNLPDHYSAILLIIIIAALVFAAYSFLPVKENANPPQTYGWGVDWKSFLRDNSLKVIKGENPYSNSLSLLPPWVYLLLFPIAVLPVYLGTAVMFTATYVVYAVVLYKLKVKPLSCGIFLLNAFVFSNAKNGNVDFLAVLGLILPPQIGLFFVLIKPQIGIGIAIYWLIEAWRKGKIKEVVRVFAPVTIAYLLSFAVYGFWPFNFQAMLTNEFNRNLWPLGIPIFLFLLYKAVKERNSVYAMGASPFASPYVNLTSYAAALLPFTSNPALLAIVVALSWLTV